MNGIKEKILAFLRKKEPEKKRTTKSDLRAAKRTLYKQAKSKLANPDIMYIPAKWPLPRTIREIWKSVMYVLLVRKNQRRAYKLMERVRRDLIKKHTKGVSNG